MKLFTKIQKKMNPENYWNNKYPKVSAITYQGRSIPKHGMYMLDVRNFFTNPLASELQKIIVDLDVGKTSCDDQKALHCVCWVQDHIKYVSDKMEYGLPEFWCYPSETLHVWKGDCDDGAILLANLMLASGIAYWKIRLTAGMVPDGGHCYVTYYVADKTRWVALDWCYYPNRLNPRERRDYKLSRIYREVWFSWNSKYAFFKGTRVRSSAEMKFKFNNGVCIIR